MNLLISLRSEILKSKRTASFYLTISAAFFAPFMSMLDLILDGIGKEHQHVIFSEMLINKFEMTGSMMLPLFIILICTMLPQIEFRNHTWKQLLTTPQSKASIYLSKYLNIQILILSFLVFNLLFMFMGSVILHYMHPQLNVLNQSVDMKEVLLLRAKVYTVLLALCSIQFWLGLRFKNFIAPIGIGMGLWFGGTIFALQVQSEITSYFPYCYHVFASIEHLLPKMDTALIMSPVYAVVFLATGYWDFNRRRMNG